LLNTILGNTIFKRYYERREVTENKNRVIIKLIYAEAFAVLNIYYLDLQRKKKANLLTNDKNKTEATIQKLHSISKILLIMSNGLLNVVFNDVTRDICENHEVSFTHFSQWTQTSEDGHKLH
jgi:hypothetical protein